MPTTIHPWPASLVPDRLTIRLQAHTSRFESPFTRATQTQELPGGRFVLSAEFPPLDSAQARTWRALLAKLRGSAGRFYFLADDERAGVIPAFGAADVSLTALTADNTHLTADRTDYRADATVWFADPVVTIGAAGDSVTITGATNQLPGVTIIEAGRYVSFDTADGWRQLALVVEDAVVATDQSVSITVEPPMRVRPAAGAPFHMRSASGVFMLVDDDQGALSKSPGLLDGASIEAIEAYPLRLPP